MAGCKSRNVIILVTATPDSPAPLLTPRPVTGSLELRPIGTAPPLDPAAFVVPTPNPTRVGVPDPLEEDIYIVQFGDTISLIAEHFGITPQSLLDSNSLSEDTVLNSGQVLISTLYKMKGIVSSTE